MVPKKSTNKTAATHKKTIGKQRKTQDNKRKQKENKAKQKKNERKPEKPKGYGEFGNICVCIPFPLGWLECQEQARSWLECRGAP